MPRCTFKLVYTGLRYTFDADDEVTLEQIKTFLRDRFYLLFNHRLTSNEDFLLVPFCQDALAGRQNEEMDGIAITNSRLCDLYPGMVHVYFYIRKTVVGDQLIPEIDNNAHQNIVNMVVVEAAEAAEAVEAAQLEAMVENEIDQVPVQCIASTYAKCCICLVENVSILFMPCRHLKTCSTCGYDNRIIVCPVCRVDITEKLFVYM